MWCDGMNRAGSGRLSNQRGVTLVELLIVVAIVAVMFSIASVGFDGWKKRRLMTATTDLLADLQFVRMSALTESSDDPDARGFGLRFLGNNQYKIFEFIDDETTDFTYEGETEESDRYEKNLSGGITVESGTATPLIKLNGGVDEAVLLYDKKGMRRSFNWSSVAGRTYVLRHPGVNKARCVTVAQVRIREGVWNGSACELR